MPQVLDYASPRKRRRWSWIANPDLDLAGVSLIQLGAWARYLLKPYDVQPVPGDQQSLFAFAWRFEEDGHWIAFVGILATAVIGIAALCPAAKRGPWYRAYLIWMLAVFVLDSVALAAASVYLDSQLPGVWGSLRLGLVEDPGIPPFLVVLLQPVFWMLVVRAVVPGHQFVGRGAKEL